MNPIAVVSFGVVDSMVTRTVAAHILGYLHIDTEMIPSLEFPQYAFNPQRLQFDAGIILKSFESLPFYGYSKVVGILEADLFVPILTYVFGEARQGGKCAVVSLPRLRKNPDNTDAPKPLFWERTAKVAMHELGHLFNLVHCESKKCLMHFSGGVRDLDSTPPYLCRYCSIYLRDGVAAL